MNPNHSHMSEKLRMVIQGFNPSRQEADLCELVASPAYMASPRSAKATQQVPVEDK